MAEGESPEILPEEKLYLVGEGEKQIAMPETEMVRRIEEWYDNLSEKDKKKFRERLWAPIRELGEQQRGQRAEAGTEGAAGAIEGPGPDAPDRPQSDPSTAELAEAFEEYNGEMYR